MSNKKKQDNSAVAERRKAPRKEKPFLAGMERLPAFMRKQAD